MKIRRTQRFLNWKTLPTGRHLFHLTKTYDLPREFHLLCFTFGKKIKDKWRSCTSSSTEVSRRHAFAPILGQLQHFPLGFQDSTALYGSIFPISKFNGRWKCRPTWATILRFRSTHVILRELNRDFTSLAPLEILPDDVQVEYLWNCWYVIYIFSIFFNRTEFILYVWFSLGNDKYIPFSIAAHGRLFS